MKKIKLLIMACALLGVGQAWAQTDVTSTYIANADFEGSYTSLSKVNNTSLDNRSVQDPDGWTLTCTGSFHRWDSSVLSSTNATYSSNVSKRITIPSSGFGNQTYAFRCQGTNSGEVLRLSQTPTLPRGKYTLSAKLHTDHKDNMEASIYAFQFASDRVKATTNAAKDVWDDVSKSFTLVSERAVEIGIYFSHNTTADYTAAVDNVTLFYENYTDDLSTMITKATALDNSSLSSAISAAQDVLDDKDNTVAYQTTIDNAVSTLQAAIIDAQSADGSSLTPAIQNAGFEGEQSWYVKTTGANTYDVDQWVKSSAFDASTYHYSYLATDQKSEGSNSFKVRFNWADASQTFTQRIPGLRLGRYTMTADVKVSNGSQSTIDAYIKGNSVKGESVTATTSGFNTITAVVDLNEAGDLDIILGMDYDYTGNGSSGSEAVIYWDNITLTYNSPVDLYNTTKASAQEVYNHSDYENITGSERTALYNLLNPDPAPSTVSEYFAAIDNINAAVLTFTSAKTNYDKYAAESANATALGVSSVPALNVASNYSDMLNNLIVLEDAAVTAGYTKDATKVIDAWDVSSGTKSTWTGQNAGTDNTDHWSGETKSYYNKYDSKGFTMKASKTVSLPAGSYVLKAAARCNKVNGANDFYLGATVDGETLVKEIYTSTGGGTGLGIDKTGAANYTEADDTYANSNNGYGWEWRFVPFVLTETKDVELKITANILASGWVSFSDIQLLTTSENVDVFEQIYNTAKTSAESARDHANYENVSGKERKDLTDAIEAEVTETIDWYSTQKTTLDNVIISFIDAKANYDILATAISNANTIVTNSINVGDGVFQVPTTIRETLAEAQETAEATKNNTSTTSADAADAATTLNNAISTYNTDFAAAELNAPEAGKRYGIINVTPSSSFDYSGKALTFYVNSSQSEGGYGYKYMLDPNINYAQGYIFTPVEGEKNVYTLSFIDADGNIKYLCTQYGYNENASGDKVRIRTTENETYALKIRIDITTTENVWKLYNTEAQKNIGTNGKDNNDLFTNADRSDIRIIEVNQTSVPVSISSDILFATRIFPFTPELPSGVKAYACAATEGEVLTLEEVTEPAANTPYILYAEDGYTGDALTGYGTAAAATYTSGLLTGVYTATAAPVGSYVLQNNNEGLAFYKVAEGKQPNVGAYRAYLTVSNNNARALFFSFDDDNKTTAVKTIEALTSGKSEIYNTSGVRQNALQKGMNILKMEDGSIRKVMIK